MSQLLCKDAIGTHPTDPRVTGKALGSRRAAHPASKPADHAAKAIQQNFNANAINTFFLLGCRSCPLCAGSRSGSRKLLQGNTTAPNNAAVATAIAQAIAAGNTTAAANAIAQAAAQVDQPILLGLLSRKCSFLLATPPVHICTQRALLLAYKYWITWRLRYSCMFKWT